MNLSIRFAAGLVLASACSASFASSLALTVRDSAGKPLADTVIYVEPEGGGALPKHVKGAEIEQKGLKFIPLVTVVQTGSKINFPNNDKVRHHIYSFSPAHKFDQKLYSGVAATPQVFDKAGTVVLGCNIHDKMIAYVKIVDTPYFAKTDAAGIARIDVPSGGKYAVHAWHFNMTANAAADQVVDVKAGEAPTSASFSLAMKPPVADPDNPDARY